MKSAREGATMRELALGIDLGTTAVKVGLFAVDDGRTVAVRSEPNGLDTPHPGWAECPPTRYLDRTADGIRGVLADAPVGSRVVSVGLSSQGQTFVMLDADGRPVRPGIVWLDTRAGAEAEEIASGIPRATFYRQTGIPFANPVDSAPKVLWVRRHEPEVFARTAHVLTLPAHIAWWLTGRMASDTTNAGSTGLLGADGAWWPEAVDTVGLRLEQLGEVLAPGSLIGALTDECSRSLGLPSGTPVSAGTNDQAAGALSMGNRAPGMVSATVGTAMAVQATLPTGVDPFATGLLIGRHPLGGAWSVLSYMKTAAIALTWFRDRFAPGVSYEDLTREASDAPVGAGGLTFLPHLTGMGTPSFDGSVRGAFLHMGMEHERKHFVRAVLESVCFGARESLDLVRGLYPALAGLTVSGGATRSDAWMRMMADCLGIPVTVAECGEAACRGGAMLGLLGAGNAAALGWPATAGDEPPVTYIPDPANADAYDGAYARYLAAMDTLYPGAREVKL
jgi:xylulokinase